MVQASTSNFPVVYGFGNINFFVEVAKKGEAAKVVYTHWLMKSEPDTRLENGVDVKFGLEDLKKSPEQTACWDGVRNYQVKLGNGQTLYKLVI